MAPAPDESRTFPRSDLVVTAGTSDRGSTTRRRLLLYSVVAQRLTTEKPKRRSNCADNVPNFGRCGETSGARPLARTFTLRAAYPDARSRDDALMVSWRANPWIGHPGEDAHVKVKMVLPALTEVTSPLFRPIKYSLFPPLGLATLAGFLDPSDDVTIEDEHVERVRLDDEPDLVVIQVYITSASRAYRLADHYRRRGVHVCLGGLHVTSLPDEAAQHADTIFLGPGEDTWPAFLTDYRAGRPAPLYRSTQRTLAQLPPIRRDLIKRQLYLVPNSIVVSRGCPHSCDFCYKDAFFEGGRGFYTQTVEAALAEIDRLPGRHLYFLDDHIFGNARFATELFEGMRGMGRLWQAAATVQTVLRPGLVELAAEAGLRSLFVGFETLSTANLVRHGKRQNLGRDYAEAIRRLHDNGVMVNASFVFGMDDDGPDVFERTVDWAVRQGVETATFHILTPYPGTVLYQRMKAAGRLVTSDWDRYDTRHAVFMPARLTPSELEEGYWRAYREFYTWRNIVRGARAHPDLRGMLRQVAYAGGWKRCEPLWDLAIRAKRVAALRPALESVLSTTKRDRGARVETSSASDDESGVSPHDHARQGFV